ncbi:MAG: hypothetical protein SGI73_20730 [Chloroflexota bacterium]|nr:hypothetical protein [Chloroflexota bacterium]
MNSALATAFLVEVEQISGTLPDPAVDPQEMYFIVQHVIDHPTWRIKHILDAYEAAYKRKISLQVQHFLKREALWDSEDRAGMRDALVRTSPALFRLFTIEPHPLSQADYHAMRAYIRSQPNSMMLSFMLLAGLTAHLEDSDDEPERQIGKALKRFIRRSSREAPNRLLTHLFDTCAEFHQFERRSALDTLRDLNDKAAELAHAPRVEANDDEPSENTATTLMHENADLRATLIGLRHELERLDVQFEQQQEQAQQKAIYSFLSQMNHVSNGYLLDRLIQNAVDIETKMMNGWQPEIEVEGAVYLIPALKEFFAQIGVIPLRTIGERATITLDDLQQIQYMGSEFHDRSEQKRIEFRTSGWGYAGRILSRPEAIEIETI